MRASDYEHSQGRGPFAPDHSVGRLTAREDEFARLVAAGLKDMVIARRLGLSPSTVSTYVRRVQRRLGLASRAEIITWVAARARPDDSQARLRRVDAVR